MTAVYIVLFLAAIVAANLITATFGPSASIVNAFFLIGLDLTVRDQLHEAWEGHLLRNMGLLIATGGLLSYLLNVDAGPIAIASTVAFAAAATADTAAYHAARRWPYLARVNFSNMFGAAVDSVVFPTLAFGGVLWGITAGQFAAKMAGGFLWALVIAKFRKKAR